MRLGSTRFFLILAALTLPFLSSACKKHSDASQTKTNSCSNGITWFTALNAFMTAMGRAHVEEHLAPDPAKPIHSVFVAGITDVAQVLYRAATHAALNKYTVVDPRGERHIWEFAWGEVLGAAGEDALRVVFVWSYRARAWRVLTFFPIFKKNILVPGSGLLLTPLVRQNPNVDQVGESPRDWNYEDQDFNPQIADLQCDGGTETSDASPNQTPTQTDPQSQTPKMSWPDKGQVDPDCVDNDGLGSSCNFPCGQLWCSKDKDGNQCVLTKSGGSQCGSGGPEL